MAKNLVIIESPTKAHTIQSSLGPSYKVVASKGHVRDLPLSSFGIDIENGFAPHYINIRGKGELINELRKEAKAATRVFLATDPDREGEAISWHLATVLAIPEDKVMRVTFNELTKNVIKTSIKNPRPIDMNLVDAQQSRRILDRIVGYKLSPMLWHRVKNGLSAGRVQSVATRLVVERENEIRAFVPERYWTVSASVVKDGRTFPVRYFGTKNGEKVRLTDEKAAEAIKDSALGGMTVKSVRHGTKQRIPAPPFTTSTMQQEASRKLGFQSQRTMKTAQELYEGMNLGPENGGTQGLITYMRTDSLRVSSVAQDAARQFISDRYGKDFIPQTPRDYKPGVNIQDAHEAIRPARVELTPADVRKYLTADQYRLYKLIWERFVASQMESAKLDTLTVDLICGDSMFRTGGYSVTFQGFLALYEESSDETVKNADDDDDIKNIRIPSLTEGENLTCGSSEAVSHLTEAPPRYTEASLIRTLEEKGIGRPSTITPTITTIVAREYVKRDGKSLVPTKLGEVTTDIMKQDFSDIVDYSFTAGMENKLDLVANGELPMISVLDEFWKDFSKELEAEERKEKENVKEKIQIAEETDLICEKCGSRMVVRKGRFGRFAACPNYPGCRNTKPLDTQNNESGQTADKPAGDEKCPECGQPLAQRTGPYGPFLACTAFPQCKYIKKDEKAIDATCPDCGGRILTRRSRRGKVFYSCEKYPACGFSSWDLPTPEKCPGCGGMLFMKGGKNPMLVCRSEGCGWTDEAGEMPDLPYGGQDGAGAGDKN